MTIGISMDQENCRIQEMEQSSCLEEIRVSENPPQYGITPKEAKSAELIFEESRTALSRQAQ